MFAIPLVAYGFGIATMDDPGTFSIVWMVVIGLVASILMLASLDAVNTMRLRRVAQQRLEKEYRAALALSVERVRQTDGPKLKLVGDEPKSEPESESDVGRDEASDAE